MTNHPNRSRVEADKFQAWLEQARFVIAQGQSEVDFIAHCHIDNRPAARKAYRAALAETR